MEPPSPGALYHVEIGVEDVERAKAFYGACFGWTFTDIPQMNYTLFQSAAGGVGGGLMKRPEGFPAHMVNFVRADDIDASAAAVLANGGNIVRPKREIPGIGWDAIVADTEGNGFGLWQAAG